MGGLRKEVVWIFVMVVVLLPSLGCGRSSSFIVRELQQSEPKVKEQKLDLLTTERMMMQRTTSLGSYQPKKVKGPSVMSMESARQVPTGPDPLHHNGSPIKPSLP